MYGDVKFGEVFVTAALFDNVCNAGHRVLVLFHVSVKAAEVGYKVDAAVFVGYDECWRGPFAATCPLNDSNIAEML